MKTAIYIVAGLAIFFVMGLVGAVLFLVSKLEYDKNKSKTEAARKGRWPTPGQSETLKAEETLSNHVTLNTEDNSNELKN